MAGKPRVEDRPEWRPRQPRYSTSTIVRARARADGEAEVMDRLPPARELLDRAIRVLLDVAEHSEIDNARVGAARTLAELVTRGKVGGDDVEQLTDVELDERRKRLAARVLGLTEKEEEANHESEE